MSQGDRGYWWWECYNGEGEVVFFFFITKTNDKHVCNHGA